MTAVRKTRPRGFADRNPRPEAIPPDVLSRMAVEATEARQDTGTMAEALEREAEARADLVAPFEGAA